MILFTISRINTRKQTHNLSQTRITYSTLLHQLLRVARAMLGKALFGRLMRGTIYGQFIAGEKNQEILALAARNQKHGVGSMFAYTAAEMHGTGTLVDKMIYL